MISSNNPLYAALRLTPVEQALRYVYLNGLTLDPGLLADPAVKDFFVQPDGTVNEKEFSLFRELAVNKGLAPDSTFIGDDTEIAIFHPPRFMKAPEHYHEDYMEIQVVLNGELKETIDNIPVRLKAGDLCFVAPRATHNPFVTDSETLVYCMVVPYQTLYRAFPRFTAFKSTIYTFISRFLYSSEYQPMLVCPTGSDPVIYEILLAAVREAEEDSPYIKELLFNHLQAIILYLLKDHEQDFIIAHTTKADHRNMDHIITYIRQNYNSVTLPALSEKFGYSESYLSTMIRKSTGTTFQQFLMDLRLEHAALALKNTDTEVASIITSVGYREKSHFYRIFKKKYGMSPTEYRDLSRRIIPSSKDGRD